jgi:Azurin
MAHNFALLAAEADVDAFVRASITAPDNGYIAPDMQDWVIANTAMLGGGESDEITFTAPTEPGEYVFICSFPGHYTGGMVGVLIVE